MMEELDKLIREYKLKVCDCESKEELVRLSGALGALMQFREIIFKKL